MAAGRFVSYLRVSTDRQGRSGLGLEAQRKAVSDYLNGGRWELLGEYVEVESGKKDNRPQLTKALQQCRVTGAKLVVAKLDRLSRDDYFLSGLQRAGIQFVAADMPDATELTLGIMIQIAKWERTAISERTKAALAAAKARGTKLGNPNGAMALRGLGNDRAVAAVKANAEGRAENLREVVADVKGAGIVSLAGIAEEMNRRGILTPRGGRWHPASVARLVARLEG